LRFQAQKELLHVIFAFEFVYAARCIDELLLAGKERMAGRANLNLDFFLSGASWVFGTANALDNGFCIFRMNGSFHNLLDNPASIDVVSNSLMNFYCGMAKNNQMN